MIQVCTFITSYQPARPCLVSVYYLFTKLPKLLFGFKLLVTIQVIMQLFKDLASELCWVDKRLEYLAGFCQS